MGMYEVIKGRHCKGKKAYTKGQVIESVKDMTKLFRGKFRKVSSSQVQAAPEAETDSTPSSEVMGTEPEVEQSPMPSSPVTKVEVPEPTIHLENNLGLPFDNGVEMTERFPKAVESNLTVWRSKTKQVLGRYVMVDTVTQTVVSGDVVLSKVADVEEWLLAW